jgi:transglutaminase-like putative cysteine protease
MSASAPDYWNSKHPTAEIVYRGRPLPASSKQYALDVRRFIWGDDVTLFAWCEGQPDIRKAAGQSSDAIALAIQQAVCAAITYVSDASITTGWTEFWQFPVETIARQAGDCEDGAILIASLCRLLGVPNWRIRVAAGTVQAGKAAETGGHAWASYCRETDNQWVALDWCYLPDQGTPVDQKPPINTRPELFNGNRVWFSFNDYFAWSHRAIITLGGRLREGETSCIG